MDELSSKQCSALARVYQILIDLAEEDEKRTADSGQAGSKTESAAGKPPADKPGPVESTTGR